MHYGKEYDGTHFSWRFRSRDLLFQVVSAVGRAKDGLDIWEQEVEEAIQAMSEPVPQDGPVFLGVGVAQRQR